VFLPDLVFPDQRGMMPKLLRFPAGRMMPAAAVVPEVLGLVRVALLLRRRDDS
jgi:hypothetical protein